MSELKPDLCVIGAGAAGLSLAAGAAAFGAPVVLIERGEMGGECLNTGCVPSKALLAAAKAASAMRTAGRFGIAPVEPKVDFPAVMAHVAGVIADIAPNDSQARFEGLGVTVLRASARFVAPDALEAGGRIVRPRRFVVATGSRPVLPPIPGLDEGFALTNETLFALAELPRRLLVIGGGAVGCEMALAFRRLGSEVALVEAGRILGKDEPEAVAILKAALLREGVEVIEGAKVARAAQVAGAVTLELEGGRRLEGTHLLVAAGRRANLDGLDADAGGIAVGERGVAVDAGLRSVSNRRVYAIGDAVGGGLTHAAGYHASLVIRSALFRLPVRVDDTAIPRAVFTDPELAQAGLTEAAARERHGAVRVERVDFAHNDRALTERRGEGFIKVVATRRGRILGATIVGEGAGEMANAWQLAVSAGLNLSSFARSLSPYPTVSEVGRRAATAFFAPTLTSPMMRRIIALLRRFG